MQTQCLTLCLIKPKTFFWHMHLFCSLLVNVNVYQIKVKVWQRQFCYCPQCIKIDVLNARLRGCEPLTTWTQIDTAERPNDGDLLLARGEGQDMSIGDPLTVTMVTVGIIKHWQNRCTISYHKSATLRSQLKVSRSKVNKQRRSVYRK